MYAHLLVHNVFVKIEESVRKLSLQIGLLHLIETVCPLVCWSVRHMVCPYTFKLQNLFIKANCHKLSAPLYQQETD